LVSTIGLLCGHDAAIGEDQVVRVVLREREQGDDLTQSLPSGKDAATQIAGAMHVVFQSISSSAMVPEQWHTALLMPIYKGKGQLADPSDYRPLSIPDVACRVWGSILNQRLLETTKDILPDTMFGFRPGRRTADPRPAGTTAHD
jgi:hypothetical protein